MGQSCPVKRQGAAGIAGAFLQVGEANLHLGVLGRGSEQTDGFGLLPAIAGADAYFGIGESQFAIARVGGGESAEGPRRGGPGARAAGDSRDAVIREDAVAGIGGTALGHVARGAVETAGALRPPRGR